MSELDQYLDSQSWEAALDSSGHFTIDRQKALEKLAQFQLPGEHHWALKVVQAAVAFGSAELEISLTLSFSQFLFSEGCTLDELEEAFFQPEPGPSRGLNHFKTALWSVGYGGLRPFQYCPAHSTESLVWTGERFQRVACRAARVDCLTVSQRTRQQDQRSLFLLREIEAAQANQQLSEVLVQGAYACPIPLRLGGKRLDVLQHCPQASLSDNVFPLGLVSAQGDFPKLAVPGASRHFQRVTPKGLPLPNYALTEDFLLPGCFALVTGQMHADVEATCSLLWVLDGVVVAHEALAHRAEVSAAVLVSAEGLATDLTGFTLIASELKEARKAAALAALTGPVNTLRLDFTEQVKQDREGMQGLGMTALGFSAFTGLMSFMFSAGPVLVVTGAFAAVGFKLLGYRASATEETGRYLRDGLLELQQKWPEGLVKSGSAKRPSKAVVPAAVENRQPDVEGRQPKWRRQK